MVNLFYYLLRNLIKGFFILFYSLYFHHILSELKEIFFIDFFFENKKIEKFHFSIIINTKFINDEKILQKKIKKNY